MKPTAIKILEGNRGKRELNSAEPSYPKLSSNPPAFLDAGAVAEWERMKPLLDANGLITEADLAAFAIYCQAYSDYSRLTLQIRCDGESVKDKFDSVKKHPLLSAKSQAYLTMSEMLKQFGFTPNARQKIAAQVNSENRDELEGTGWF